MVLNEKKVGIIDFDGGNYRSVEYALKFLGSKTVKIKNDGKFDVEYLVFPGVGSFDYVMKQLKKNNLDKYITKWIKEKKPFLGICVGMQILSTFGYEFEKSSGLDYIKGKVTKLKTTNYRLPHVGWNSLNIKKNSELFKELDENSYFYFVHSYIFEVENNLNILSVTNYDIDFVSSVQKENLFGVQFHPEKSQKSGLLVLKNFINL